MKKTVLLALSFTLVLAPAMWAQAASVTDYSWPEWRGPLASGVAPGGDPPLTWSEQDNIVWKVAIPGRGHGAPIVWDDQVFVLTAVPVEQEAETPVAGADARRAAQAAGPVRWTVMALDRATGTVVWEHVARQETPHEGTHTDGSWASASAVTDGEVLIAHFGSQGLYAYDLGGDLLWSKDLGDMTTRNGFGEGSSPTLAGSTLVVNWDHEGDSFIVALDKLDGHELWRRERDEVTSWATPLVVEQEGRRQVVVNATGRVRGYDLATGEELWAAGGQTVNVIPSPVHGAGLVFATSGFRGSALKAIRLASAKGEVVDSTGLAWSYDRDTPYVPSPLLYDDQLYFLKVNSGIVTSLDAATGTVRFGPERLPGIDGIYASPVGAAGRVYFVGRNGTTVVLRHASDFEVIASNLLDDDFSASPAIAGRELFLRGAKHLYCIADATAP